MAKHHTRLIAGLIVGIVVSGMAIGGSAFISRASNAPVETSDKVRIVDDRKPPAQWVINAAYGRGALSNLRAALDEIGNDNPEEARKGVTVASSLLAKIKPEPPRTAIDRSDATTPRGDPGPEANLILVHSEVRVLGNSDPDNSVQSKLDGIRDEIDMNDHEAIIAALESLNIPLAYTRVDLPLTETIALAGEALQALDARDSELARAKLMEVANGLRIDTVRVGVERSPADSAGGSAAG